MSLLSFSIKLNFYCLSIFANVVICQNVVFMNDNSWSPRISTVHVDNRKSYQTDSLRDIFDSYLRYDQSNTEEELEHALCRVIKYARNSYPNTFCTFHNLAPPKSRKRGKIGQEDVVNLITKISFWNHFPKPVLGVQS